MIKIMKNRKYLFRPLDIIIYFNIVMFIVAPMQSTKGFSVVMLFSLSLAFFNFLFLLFTINLRYKLHKSILQEVHKEAILEEKAQKEGNKDFIYLKQELLENRVLAELRQELPSAKFIHNAYIPKQDQSFSEIDILVIDRKGIFIIEVKNLAGRIVGDWKNDDYLKIEHPGGNTYTLYNPIKQNTGHFKNLKSVTGIESKYFRSIIVFGDHTLFDFKTVPNYARICQLRNLMKAIDYASKLNPVEIETHQIDQIYETLYKYLNKTEEKAQQHIDNVQNKQK